MESGFPASAENAETVVPRALKAATPAAKRSSSRPTSATAKPSLANFCASDADVPGPYPMIAMIFDIVFPQDGSALFFENLFANFILSGADL
jgi:hypothetical protein